jgi:hypothetical protein
VTTPALVWLIVGLLSLAAVLALLVGLIRHGIVLGRAAGRFRDEVGPIAREISDEADRASDRSQRLARARSFGRS